MQTKSINLREMTVLQFNGINRIPLFQCNQMQKGLISENFYVYPIEIEWINAESNGICPGFISGARKDEAH